MSFERNLKTSGFILKKIDFSEADRIFLIFSEKLGKISAIAKGVKKIKSKIGGHIEFFTKTDFELYQSHSSELYKLTGANNLIVNQNIIDDLDLMKIGYEIIKLLNKFTEEKYPLPKIFSLTEKTFFALNQKQKTFLVFLHFQIKFFSILGILPNFQKCLKCEKKINNNQNFFDPIDLGIICPNCLPIKSNYPELDFNTIKTLYFLQNCIFEQSLLLNLTPEEIKKIQFFQKIILQRLTEN